MTAVSFTVPFGWHPALRPVLSSVSRVPWRTAGPGRSLERAGLPVIEIPDRTLEASPPSVLSPVLLPPVEFGVLRIPVVLTHSSTQASSSCILCEIAMW